MTRNQLAGKIFVTGLVMSGGFFARPASAGLLLSDNYTSDQNTNNIDYNLPVREAGSYTDAGTSTYVNYSSPGPNAQLGNTGTLRQGDGNYLLMASGSTVSPDADFNVNSALTIQFDVDPDHVTNSTDWTAINLGMTLANQNVQVNGAAAHFGFLFRANGQYQVFNGGTAIAAGTYGPSNLGGTNNNFFTVSLQVYDPTDGNPFDGVGQTNIDVYSTNSATPSVPVYSDVITGGGLTDNYIDFQSNQVGGIDNLAITQAPEPASMALLGIAGLGLLARRRVSRR